MAKKTFLQKLQDLDNSKTFKCKQNDIVLLFKKSIGDDSGEVHILDSETATYSTVVGMNDLKDFINFIK